MLLQSPRRRDAAGRARISSTDPSGTELVVDGAPAGTTIRVGSRPDAARAAAVRSGVDRVLWQQLTTSEGGATADVYAVAHRRPRRLRVTGATALGLLESGVPTVVRSGGAA